MGIIGQGFANILSRTWWALLLRGIVAILFAICAFTMPGISLTSLTLLFGAFVFIDGIAGVYTAIAGRHDHEQWVILLLWALMGVAIGAITLFTPSITTLALLFYIAIWAIATGVLQILAAIRLRKEITGEWRLIAAGILSILVGGFLIERPAAGALAFIWLIGAYAFVHGVALVILALKVRSFGKAIGRRLEPQPVS